MAAGGGGGGPAEATADMEVASFFDGDVGDDVAAVQTVVKEYAFSLRSPLPDLEEMFFRVIKPHRNTLEYLGVFCGKLELVYARALAREAATADMSAFSPSILPELAAAFGPYIIRPRVWGAAQDAQAKRRARFLQHRFVLLFWFFFKRKHNIVTRAERADLNRSSQEVRPARSASRPPPFYATGAGGRQPLGDPRVKKKKADRPVRAKRCPAVGPGIAGLERAAACAAASANAVATSEHRPPSQLPYATLKPRRVATAHPDFI